MVAKTKKEDQELLNLSELFKILQQYTIDKTLESFSGDELVLIHASIDALSDPQKKLSIRGISFKKLDTQVKRQQDYRKSSTKKFRDAQKKYIDRISDSIGDVAAEVVDESLDIIPVVGGVGSEHRVGVIKKVVKESVKGLGWLASEGSRTFASEIAKIPSNIDAILTSHVSPEKKAFEDWIKKNRKKLLSSKENKYLTFAGFTGKKGAELKKKLKENYSSQTGVKI